MPSKDSKTNFALLRDRILQKSGKDYWRSVEEFVDAPEFEEFVSREYPQHAEEWEDGLSRRNFIKIMGASLALAGLSGCVIQPSEKIIPYVRQPEEIIPGKPLYFATAMTLGGVATGLLAKSNEGRPTKLEGNPEHPGSLGATDVLAQASLLGMYDPDRSQQVTYLGNPTDWEAFMKALRATTDENRAGGGAGIRFLTETITSPTLIAQFKQILAELPNARWYQYEPVNQDNAMAGAKMAFGSAAHAIYKFDQADKVLSLDSDFLSGFNVRYIKDFSKKRNLDEATKTMSRVYAVETTLSLTGAKADHRLGVKPSQVPEIAKAIAKALGVAGANSTAAFDDKTNKWISAMAKDLQASKGKSIVIAGDNQPPMVHALAHSMNAALSNVGTTVSYTEPFQQFADIPQVDQLRQLVQEIDSGAVKMLVMLGGNPTYNTPADLKLSHERLDKVPFRVHLSQHFDETSEICHWHVSEKHFLEMWSDSRAYDGTVTLTQPLIQPLYDSKSAHEVIQLFAKENFDKKDLDIVRDNWKANGSVMASGDFEKNWRKAVHDGFIANTAVGSAGGGTGAIAAKTVAVNPAFMNQPSTPTVNNNALEISIIPDPCAYDGRFSNNGWLQELPKPLTKVTWDNVALISPKTAQRLWLNQKGRDDDEQAGGSEGTPFINTKGGNLISDLVTLTYQGAEIGGAVPMWILPGQPDDVITITMGYGRTKAGQVGTGLGYNAFDVRRSDAMYFGTGDVKGRGTTTQIASTQTHFNMEGRDILRTWDVNNLEQAIKDGEQEDFYPESMYPGFQYNGNKWGMSIDLNSCVGCNACVIACQSENNIPVVGKEQVSRSREMQWMRIDAYYNGDDLNNPDGLNFQPLLCQQCEQAPCETVCPVHATVHSAEGLNDMVYNRCVGTRYCSNNCPYKVRRFNFLLYQDWNTPQYKLMRNPEVTVRSRGVMEKCTYCTQRIASARIEAEKDKRNIRDGEIVTACQAVCPTDAITFGDLNDPNSAASKTKKDHRTYNLLNDLNTQPRTTYMAGLKNQNREMPDYVPMKSKASNTEEADKARTGEATEPKH